MYENYISISFRSVFAWIGFHMIKIHYMFDWVRIFFFLGSKTSTTTLIHIEPGCFCISFGWEMDKPDLLASLEASTLNDWQVLLRKPWER